MWGERLMKILRKTNDVIHNARDLDARPEPPELPRPVVRVASAKFRWDYSRPLRLISMLRRLIF